MQLSIRHTTTYSYDAPVSYALQKVRLHPLSSSVQTVQGWRVTIEGGKIEAGYRDHFGNHTDLVSATPGTQKITLSAEGTVETHDTSGILGQVFGRAPLWLFRQHTALTEAGDAVRPLKEVVAGADTTLNGLHALLARILDAVPYTLGKTGTTTTAEDALALGAGVCQDHANIFIATARAAGLPARYVSGYLMMNDRVDQDASHAWAEVYLEDLGWVGFDVSNGVSPDDRYVRIATGRDANDAAPISGLRMGNADEALIVSLQIQQ